MSSVTLGGERLGSGNKIKQYLHNYERSTHDLSYLWRSTMAPGTLVPFMSELALPGDTFDINLDVDVLTLPTIGPLFGSYKIELDVFQVPIRLYQAQLHMNALGIGLNMQDITLPQIILKGPALDNTRPPDNQQINPSCILKYLGISGIGWNSPAEEVERSFNAVPYLAMFDIYKQYYSNKQEEVGYIIHKPLPEGIGEIDIVEAILYGNVTAITTTPADPPSAYMDSQGALLITFDTWEPAFSPEMIKVYYVNSLDPDQINDIHADPLNVLFKNVNINVGNAIVTASSAVKPFYISHYEYDPTAITFTQDASPVLVQFPLSHIDDMRLNILSAGKNPVIIDNENDTVYGYPIKQATLNGWTYYNQLFNQEGLLIKTYNSDIYNNWVNTEWLDGTNGVNEVTKVEIVDGSFTINELQLNKKIYDMLMRIAISGGTYDDWLDSVYTHERNRGAENPMFIGGKIKNIVFQEVISTAATENNPLGTLAGRGKIGSKNKGGHIIAKIDEPSYIIGIASITPNIDYSQGNKWDMNLKTMDDLHKPALDGIGFQPLITDNLAWFDTKIETDPIFKAAGQQPAWLNYMTNVNRVFGNFAEENSQMFMVLNRRYEAEWSGDAPSIKDLTTYIDPVKFNHIFADTRLDAQNFMVQIAIHNTARRKMSAKQIPNL